MITPVCINSNVNEGFIMAIDTSKLMAGISFPKTGLKAPVTNNGTPKPAIDSTTNPSTDATKKTEADSSISTGEEGKAKTEEGKKPEAKPGEQAQAKVGIDKAVKDTATPAPNQSKISTSEVLNGISEWEKKAGATVPTEPKPTTTGEAVNHTVETSGNPAFQSAHTMPTGEAAQKAFDIRGELIGGHSQDDITNRNTASSDNSQASQGANSAPGYGPGGIPGGGVGNNYGQQIGQQVNVFGSPGVTEQPPIQQQIPPPKTDPFVDENNESINTPTGR